MSLYGGAGYLWLICSHEYFPSVKINACGVNTSTSARMEAMCQGACLTLITLEPCLHVALNWVRISLLN